MAGVDYCTVLPSWEFDKDPACIVSYLFDSIDGLSEASAADYVPPNNFMNSCLTLECASNDQLTGDSREPCTLSITSKPQYRVSVLGVDIISQSRLLEVYDTCEGYMMTSRGKRIPSLDAEGGENQSDMFNCRVRLKETLFGFTVKFPSTSNMKEFNIYNIVVILNPETGDEGNGEVAPTFNMGKVRSFVDTESMSPGAQQLMRSVEQFQQNKKSAVSGLQGMFSQSSSRSAGSSSGPGMMGLMGLMSMFSNMSSASQSGSRDTPTGSNSTQPSQIDSRDLPEANNNLAASQSNARNIPQAVNRTETTHLDARSNTQASNKPKVNQPSINSTVTSQMRGTPLQTDTATNTAASLHEALPSSLNLSELRNAVVGSSSLNSGVSAESEGGDMYQMLQNICGRVSQMRTVDPEENRLVMETGIEQRHSDIPQSRLEGDTGEAEGQSSQDETAGGHKLARDTLRTVVKSCMEEFELRLQTHIDNRLSQIEQKLEAKLDSILGVLQSVKGDNSPTPTERVTHIHAEGATHIQTEGASHLSTYGDTYKPVGVNTCIPTEGTSHTNIQGATHIHTDNLLTRDHTGNTTQNYTEGATVIHVQVDTHTPTQTKVDSHTPTQTQVDTHTQTKVDSHTPTQTQVDTHTPTQTQVDTHTPTQVDTHTPTPTQVDTHTPTQVDTHTPTQTQVDTHTPTQTQVDTHTQTQVDTHTPTQTQVDTHTQTQVDTHTPTQTQVDTHTPTQTQVDTHTPTQTQVDTHTPTQTHTPLGEETEKPTDLHSDTSTAETRNQPPENLTTSLVMDDESGEHS